MFARRLVLFLLPFSSCLLPCFGADVESRRLTHYVPQDLLETVIVRTEGWTEIKLNVADGIRKEDVIRIWAGGSIDPGNGDQPSQYVCGPSGSSETGLPPMNARNLTLSPKSDDAFCLLFKTESQAPIKCRPPGKPLEIKCTKDKEKIWAGFNDEKGRFNDNHIGKGKRHQFDPLWVRIEVVRIVTD